MDILWIRIVSQVGIYLTFALYFAGCWRRGPREWVPLLGTVIYAVIFEHFNMLRYAHVPGGYEYHPATWLFIWNDVPLYIPLAWAFVVGTSRTLTDRIVVRSWAKPFSDALLALLIDLSLDAVAIRLHFWTWRGIAWSDAFFGVPADNFLGWLLVTFTFCALTRMLWSTPSVINVPTNTPIAEDRVRALVQFVLLPPLAYLFYLALEAIVHLGYWLFHAETLRQQFGVLGVVLVLFLVIAETGAWQGRTSPPTPLRNGEGSFGERGESPPTKEVVDELLHHLPRHVFHLFALIGFFCLPLAARSPSLLLLAAIIWSLELFVAWRASR